ncbi:MAG: hypothetical protein WC805_00250 [Patescibacteria group bacterium]|jgi:hypothetical protein
MANWSPKQAGLRSKNIIQLRNFKKFRWGAFSITSISIALFVVLAGSYIVIINVVSTKGAQINTLEMTKKGLVAENERLAVEAARLQSLAVIEKGATEQIEIGDNGLPTGKTKPAAEETTTNSLNETIDNQTTYVPKMVEMSALTFLEDTSGPLAQK